MRVTLIRHGSTPGNGERRYVGRTDEPLSAEGLRQTEAAGADPAVETVYTTPLRRTGQTAAQIFPRARQIVVDGLREMDFGDFEGRSAADMERDGAYRTWVEGNCVAPCPGGESREAFSRRVCAAFEEIVRQARDRGEDSLVLVVHGGTIMAVMERWAVPRRDYYGWSVGNCRGYICRVETDEAGELVLVDLSLWGEGI